MSFNNKYKELVRTILTEGVYQTSRSAGQYIIPSYSFTLDFEVESPILTLRKMWYKGVVGEFETLISLTPLTNIKQFEANGCNYWKKWSGPKGELTLDYYNELHPALERIIEQIKLEPDSRRHVISLWNNEHTFGDTLSLPCCWHSLTFSVIDSALHLTWGQRSVDTMLGLPADVYLAYRFMEYVATKCSLDIGTCMFSLSNVHIYAEHTTNAAKLLERTSDDYNNPLQFELIC